MSRALGSGTQNCHRFTVDKNSLKQLALLLESRYAALNLERKQVMRKLLYA
jgi:hypothetical protein